MRIALFIPCYMDAFQPEVGVATPELLERLGSTVDYPFDQTCFDHRQEPCRHPDRREGGAALCRSDVTSGAWHQHLLPNVEPTTFAISK